MLIALCAAVALHVADAAVERAAKSLFAADSFSVTLALNPVGGDPEEQTVRFQKPSSFRWESTTMLFMTDGKTTVQYNKRTKTYKKGTDVAAFMKEMLAQKPLWGWSAFFDEKFVESLAKCESGNSRKFRGNGAKDAKLTRKDDVAFTVTYDEATGMPVLVRFSDGEEKPDWLVVANDLVVGKPIAAETFAFSAPEGARDEAEAAKDGPTFADVFPILKQHCTECHAGPGAKKGIDLSSYAAVMGGRGMVVPGEPTRSRLIRVMRRGEMPPKGPLASETIDSLAAWIQAGAREK